MFTSPAIGQWSGYSVLCSVAYSEKGEAFNFPVPVLAESRGLYAARQEARGSKEHGPTNAVISRRLRTLAAGNSICRKSGFDSRPVHCGQVVDGEHAGIYFPSRSPRFRKGRAMDLVIDTIIHNPSGWESNFMSAWEQYTDTTKPSGMAADRVAMPHPSQVRFLSRSAYLC